MAKARNEPSTISPVDWDAALTRLLEKFEAGASPETSARKVASILLDIMQLQATKAPELAAKQSRLLQVLRLRTEE